MNFDFLYFFFIFLRRIIVSQNIRKIRKKYCLADFHCKIVLVAVLRILKSLNPFSVVNWREAEYFIELFSLAVVEFVSQFWWLICGHVVLAFVTVAVKYRKKKRKNRRKIFYLESLPHFANVIDSCWYDSFGYSSIKYLCCALVLVGQFEAWNHLMTWMSFFCNISYYFRYMRHPFNTYFYICIQLQVCTTFHSFIHHTIRKMPQDKNLRSSIIKITQLKKLTPYFQIFRISFAENFQR